MFGFLKLSFVCLVLSLSLGQDMVFAGTSPALDALARGDTALACRLTLAENDHHSGGDEFFIGNCFEAGTGIPQDFERAADWYRKAMGKPFGDRLAQAHLGRLMAAGRIAGGKTEGLRLAREAAEHGIPRAEMIYAGMLGGRDAPSKQVIVWLKRAAAGGEPGAARGLADIYEALGDKAQAEAWRAKAEDMKAESGTLAEAMAYKPPTEAPPSIAAEYNRARHILMKKEAGTVEEAVTLIEKAARFGYKEAEFQMGALYYHGIGLPQDFAEAVYWFRRSALHGLEEAKPALEQAIQDAARVEQGSSSR